MIAPLRARASWAGTATRPILRAGFPGIPAPRGTRGDSRRLPVLTGGAVVAHHGTCGTVGENAPDHGNDGEHGLSSAADRVVRHRPPAECVDTPDAAPATEGELGLRTGRDSHEPGVPARHVGSSVGAEAGIAAVESR